MTKAINILLGLAFVAVMASGVWASSVSGGFSHDPTAPDPASGHVMELSVRGTGTVYLTQAEWAPIAPAWTAYKVSLFVMLVVALIRVLHEGASGFLREWRKR